MSSIESTKQQVPEETANTLAASHNPSTAVTPTPGTPRDSLEVRQEALNSQVEEMKKRLASYGNDMKQSSSMKYKDAKYVAGVEKTKRIPKSASTTTTAANDDSLAQSKNNPSGVSEDNASATYNPSSRRRTVVSPPKRSPAEEQRIKQRREEFKKSVHSTEKHLEVEKLHESDAAVLAQNRANFRRDFRSRLYEMRVFLKNNPQHHLYRDKLERWQSFPRETDATAEMLEQRGIQYIHSTTGRRAKKEKHHQHQQQRRRRRTIMESASEYVNEPDDPEEDESEELSTTLAMRMKNKKDNQPKYSSNIDLEAVDTSFSGPMVSDKAKTRIDMMLLRRSVHGTNTSSHITSPSTAALPAHARSQSPGANRSLVASPISKGPKHNHTHDQTVSSLDFTLKELDASHGSLRLNQTQNRSHLRQHRSKINNSALIEQSVAGSIHNTNSKMLDSVLTTKEREATEQPGNSSVTVSRTFNRWFSGGGSSMAAPKKKRSSDATDDSDGSEPTAASTNQLNNTAPLDVTRPTASTVSKRSLSCLTFFDEQGLIDGRDAEQQDRVLQIKPGHISADEGRSAEVRRQVMKEEREAVRSRNRKIQETKYGAGAPKASPLANYSGLSSQHRSTGGALGGVGSSTRNDGINNASSACTGPPDDKRIKQLLDVVFVRGGDIKSYLRKMELEAAQGGLRADVRKSGGDRLGGNSKSRSSLPITACRKKL